MNILIDTKNKYVQEFLTYRKIQDGRQGSNVQNRPNLTAQITFWLSIWISFIRYGQNLPWTQFLIQQTSMRKDYQLVQNPRWPLESKVQKSTRFVPTSHISARHLDVFHQILTKFGMDILLDPNKQVCTGVNQLVQNPRCT